MDCLLSSPHTPFLFLYLLNLLSLLAALPLSLPPSFKPGLPDHDTSACYLGEVRKDWRPWLIQFKEESVDPKQYRMRKWKNSWVVVVVAASIGSLHSVCQFDFLSQNVLEVRSELSKRVKNGSSISKCLRVQQKADLLDAAAACSCCHVQ
jgi:hypothetical protein